MKGVEMWHSGATVFQEFRIQHLLFRDSLISGKPLQASIALCLSGYSRVIPDGGLRVQ